MSLTLCSTYVFASCHFPLGCFGVNAQYLHEFFFSCCVLFKICLILPILFELKLEILLVHVVELLWNHAFLKSELSYHLSLLHSFYLILDEFLSMCRYESWAQLNND